MAQVIMEKAAMPVVVEMKIAKDTQRGEPVGLAQLLSKTPPSSERLS